MNKSCLLITCWFCLVLRLSVNQEKFFNPSKLFLLVGEMFLRQTAPQTSNKKYCLPQRSTISDSAKFDARSLAKFGLFCRVVFSLKKSRFSAKSRLFGRSH